MRTTPCDLRFPTGRGSGTLLETPNDLDVTLCYHDGERTVKDKIVSLFSFLQIIAIIFDVESWRRRKREQKKVFEAPRVEAVFPEKRQAIDYAETRAVISR